MKLHCSSNALWCLVVAFIASCPTHSLSAPASGLRGAKHLPRPALLKSKVRGPWDAYYPEYKENQQWFPETQVDRITEDLEPIAPASDFSDAVTEFGDKSASPFSGLRNIPDDLHPNSFPDPYPDTNMRWSKYNDTLPEWKRLHTQFSCRDNPTHWTDRQGIGCGYYARAQWCVPGQGHKPGPGWGKNWGAFGLYAKDHIAAPEACCSCGGGIEDVVVGDPVKDLEDRETFAPGDGLPHSFHPLLAPEDRFRPYTATAAADTIPKPVARYFDHEQRQSSEPDIAGLSAEFFIYPPPRLNAGESAYITSRIDKILDFSGKYRHYYHDLDWPAPFEKEPSVWWVRWSGSLRIMKGGNYTFDVNVGWDTWSNLYIDGKPLLTKGQCKAAKTPGSCGDKGCTWCGTTLSCGIETTECPPPPPDPPGPAPAPATSPATSPAPAPAKGKGKGKGNPAPAPAGEKEEPKPTFMELSEGGHCVEVDVKVKKQRGQPTLQWKYSGPDTLNNLQIVPAHALFCRPAIAACVRPAVDACATVPWQDEAKQDTVLENWNKQEDDPGLTEGQRGTERSAPHEATDDNSAGPGLVSRSSTIGR